MVLQYFIHVDIAKYNTILTIIIIAIGFTPPEGGGHLAQQSPMQIGFSGNKVQAVTFNSVFDVEINDVSIYDLESDTGPVTGLTIWPANDIKIGGELYFANFDASSKLDKTDLYSYGMTGPNWDHFSCGVFMYESYYKENADTTYTIDVDLQYSSITSCGVNDGDWKTVCYKYSDEQIEKREIDNSNNHYRFLRLSNQEDECEIDSLNKVENNVNNNNNNNNKAQLKHEVKQNEKEKEKKLINGSTNVLQDYSPSLITMAIAGVVIFTVAIATAYWLLCKKSDSKNIDIDDMARQSFVSVGASNYGTI